VRVKTQTLKNAVFLCISMLKNILFNPAKDPRNYRWFYTSDGKLVVGGKSDEQNELVLKHFLKPSYTVMHTSKPGSGFMIIQDNEPSQKDLDECAVFCGCFSKQWKNLKNASSKIDIDVFNGKDVYKEKGMKTGTFGVKNKEKTVKIKPELVLVIQKGKLRAVPKFKSEKKIGNSQAEILGEIKPGKLGKEEAAEKIAKKIKEKFTFPISKDEIMQAIPSGKIGLK
jgi:hypothetical protein